MAVYSSGPQGGISFSTPQISINESITWFKSVAGVNPLDDNLAHDFKRIIGIQELIVTRYTAGVPQFSWVLHLDGGYNSISNGYIGAFDPSSTYIVTAIPLNATITYLNSAPPSVFVTNIQVNSLDAGAGNPVYILRYSPYTSVQPTITLAAPFALGGDDLQVRTRYYRWLPR
jgi:hypothetical protein